MRYASFIRRARVSSGSLLLTTLILAGCSSTRVVHRDLDAIGIQQINELCEYDCFATVSHHQNVTLLDTSARSAKRIANRSKDEVELNTDFDSLYSKLRMKDVYVTLSDARVITGRLSRVGADNNKWVLWKINELGQQDTVQFRATAIEEIRLLSIDQSESLVPEAESLIPYASSRLHIEAGVLTLGTGASWPISNLDEIAIRVQGRNHGRGILAGLGMGFLAGFATGAIIGAATWEPCNVEGFGGCWFHPDTRMDAATVGGVVVGALGGLLGLVVGGAVGTESATVYRYRPDSPRQMSVVVRVGPASSEHNTLE